MTTQRRLAVRPWIAVCIAAQLGALSLSAADPFQFSFSFFMAEIPEAAAGVTTAVIVADTGNDGFSGVGDLVAGSASFASSLSQGILLDGDDDLVLSVISAEEITLLHHSAFAGAPEPEILDSPPAPIIGLEQGSILFDTSVPTWSALQSGQKLGVFWFLNGSTQPGSPYGFFRRDIAGGDGGDAGFVVPGPGAVANVLVLSDSVAYEDGTVEVTGTTPLASIMANNAVVAPEPGSAALLALGLLPLMLRRRRT